MNLLTNQTNSAYYLISKPFQIKVLSEVLERKLCKYHIQQQKGCMAFISSRFIERRPEVFAQDIYDEPD